MPSGRHGNAAGIAYADGHAKMHRWPDGDVAPGKAETPPPYAPTIDGQPGPRNCAGLTNHVASRK